jgi:tetratricopeptide (TPR) repeat protein
MRIPASRSGRGGGFKIMVSGLLIWGFCLAGAGYLSLASAWYFTLNQRPSNLVTWTDCVMAPVRWHEIRAKRGDAYITEGLAAMEGKKWNEAILKIEAGLAVSPNNRQGRRQLGVFFVVVGQRERGLALLEDGFDRFYPGRADLELFLRLCAEGEDFRRAIRVIDKSLNHAGAAVERDELWIRDQMVRMLMRGERYEAGLTWIGQQDNLTELMMEFRVVSHIELNDFKQARIAFEEWEARDGRSSAVQRILVRLTREERSIEEMRNALEAMRTLDPTQVHPWIYSVVQEHLAGKEDAAMGSMEAFLLRFGGKREPLITIAAPLVEIEAWVLFEVVESRFFDMGFTGVDFDLLRCKAVIAQGKFEEARILLQESLAKAGDHLKSSDLLWFETASALAGFLATGEESFGAELLGRIGNTPFSMTTLRELADTLLKHDAEELALDILGLAKQRFPSSEYVELTHATLEQKLGARVVAEVEIPLVQDGTKLDLENEILLLAGDNETSFAVQSSKQFLAQSSRMIKNNEWGELSELLRELRRARPAWTSGFREEITMREVALNTAEKNWPALVTNVRLLLNGTVPRALKVIRIIREVDALGARSTAESLLSELERRHKNFPPAKRLRGDWAAQTVAEGAEAAESLQP